MSDAEQREEAVFEAALQLPAGERAAYLDRACGGDADLRRRVGVLLGAFERAGGFMKQPATPERTVRFPLPSTEKPGDRIDRYKILEQIGEGGCGVVYVAEQEEPVRRRVALKVIKLGMDTRQVIARFDAERQALAMMDHPNIAKVLDAGATETGRPYFVMELVRGIRITDYCEQNQVPLRERLDLFIQVCRAIQHAHQKGVIHRDIKPSNILVTLHDGEPVPKVIDFGIAKATQGRLTDQTVYTAFEQFIGTPAYMSPEQAEMSGLDIDTRSDIYSLGVLLYELLTGKTPFDAKELLAGGLDEMRRTIREVEPVKPSTRLTQELNSKFKIQNSKSEIKSAIRNLQSAIPSDLDWIVMKCLEKGRRRRYETANGLAMDIARHLNNEPITARPPSKLYRFQKSAQRNKLAFGAATAVALALVIGLAVSTAMYFKAEAEKKKAQTEAAKSQQVARFLKDMLNGVGPWVSLGRDTTLLRGIADLTAERIDGDLKHQPEVQAELLETLGYIYCETGPIDKAEELQRQSLAIRRRLFGNEDPAVASSLHGLSLTLWKRDKLDEAEIAAREALAIRKKWLGDNDTQVAGSLFMLGGILLKQGKLSESEAVERQAARIRTELGDGLGAVWALKFLGQTLDAEGKRDESETILRDAVAITRRLAGSEHLSTADALRFLGYTLHHAGKLSEAEAVLQESLAIHRKVSDQHTGMAMAWTLSELAWVLDEQGKHAEAEFIAREALTIKSKAQGEVSDTAATRAFLIDMLKRQGRQAEAEALLEGRTATLPK